MPVADVEVDQHDCFAEWRTEYVSDGRTLAGFFVSREGDGPFPGIVFHHGSNGVMPAAKAGAEALVGMGYAVFLAVRRGHSGNPGPFWDDLVTNPWGSEAMGTQLMAALADFRAGISFAGPSITWPDAPALQETLLDCMRRTEVPLFLPQAWNDVHRFLSRWRSA